MAKSELNVNRYQHPSGQPGVGVYREFCARMQHFVIWLWCGETAAYTDEEMRRKNITCEGDQETVGTPEPAEITQDVDQVDIEMFEEDEVVEPTDVEPDNEAEQSEPEAPADGKPEGFVSEAQSIRDYLTENPKAENQEVIDALAKLNIEISGSQVTRQRNKLQGK